MLCWLLQGGMLLPAAPGTGSPSLPPAPLGSAIPGSELLLPPCWGCPGPFLLFSVTMVPAFKASPPPGRSTAGGPSSELRL